MKKPLVGLQALCLLLTAVLLLSACSAPVTGKLTADLMVDIQAAEWPEAPDAPPADFAAALTHFSWNILRESAANPGNVLISPASIYLALAMTANGAAGSTRDDMLKALASADLTVDSLNAASRDWTTRLTRGSAPALTLANSIWYRTGFSADPAFLQRNADFYAAGARVLDFAKPEAVEIINGWVRDNTAGKIDKILAEIKPDVVMYLINTIHFKSDWKTPFVKNYTTEQAFAAPDGDVTSLFMHRTGDMTYLTEGGASGVLLPYVDDRFAFFAILPEAGQDPRQLIAAGDGAFLTRLFGSARSVPVTLSLPQFETEYSDSLVDEMKTLGMAVAFGAGADFSLMTADRRADLFITEIRHKTYFKINEIGTEAAAATLVEIGKTAVPGADIVLDFNRPFLYGIVDQTTGMPVFIGILDNPAAADD